MGEQPQNPHSVESRRIPVKPGLGRFDVVALSSFWRSCCEASLGLKIVLCLAWEWLLGRRSESLGLNLGSAKALLEDHSEFPTKNHRGHRNKCPGLLGG